MKYPTLENLFANVNRLRIIKFFIRNPDGFYNIADAAKLLTVRKNIFDNEAKRLSADGFLKFKRSGREKFYMLNNRFYLLGELKNLVENAISLNDDELASNLKKAGKIQLALASGVFINKQDSRADLVVVGKVSSKKMGNFIKYIESYVGRELNFVLMTPEEFKYRYKMFDRFVHDILEMPHRKIISKIKLK